jgi:hypothetical protein
VRTVVIYAKRRTRLVNLRPGALFEFESDDGRQGLAVKSEYFSGDTPQCVLLASGEYFMAEGPNELVREMRLAEVES